MGSSNQAKITYLTQKLCVAVKTTRAQWHPDGLKPIQDLIQRASKKLAEKKATGEILDFFIVETGLMERWMLIGRPDPKANGDVDIYISFGFGVRAFAGVALEKPPSPNCYCLISITAPFDEIKSWNIHALASFVQYTAMQNRWREGAPNHAHLVEIVDMALKGHEVVHYSIGGQTRKMTPAPPATSPHTQAPDPVQARKIPPQPSSPVGRQPPAKPTQPAEPTKVIASPPPGKTRPQGVLAGVVVPDDYPGKCWLQFQVSSDKMKAQISDFTMSTYQVKSLILDELWLKREIIRQGFVVSSADLIDRVMGLVTRLQNLNGLVVAQGVEGSCGDDPDLRPVPPKPKETAAAAKDGLRQTKTIPFYQKGDIVAEVYYKTPGSPGMDIYGNPSPSPPSPPYKPELGEGVKHSGTMAFEALRDGLLKVEKDKLDIVPTYLHEGDVSLASGDLHFDGSMIITGDIDSGSTVTANGDLQVQGSIRAANVRCSGNLTVTGGINTGMKASVRAGASITADYIENSVMYCKGDIKVQRAVLGSRMYTGGSITLVDTAARLAGGEVVFWNQINTAHIGFVAGAATRIHMGADWREAIRSHILMTRLAKMEAYVEKIKAEQRDLLRKSQGQMTARHKELRETIKEHLALAKKLIDTLLARQKVLIEALKFNPEATVTVRAELAGDVQFLINGKTVIGDATVSEFTVRTVAANNTHFSKAS